MSENEMIQILLYVLVAVVVLIFVLVIALAAAAMKNRSKEKKNKEEFIEKTDNAKTIKAGAPSMMEKQSIFNFMEFDTVDDNMIIQKNGTRFLMVIECQGINYDLMSGVEKASVEEGFVQFLNTLRNPIQIYIQTRSVNLENSIYTYKEKLRRIEDKLNRMRMQYYEMKESDEYTQEQIDKAFFEVTKQANLYEYGRDIINDTERMSLNNNILNQKYYIIVPYYASELGNDNLDKAEIKNLAFSEIYTRAQSLIRSLSSCEVRGKILKTNELIELLYMAYNRDEAEVFSLDKALKAGYDEINTTAPDVLIRKMKEIDKYIEEKALEKARDTANKVMSDRQRRVEEKEESMEDLIREMAKSIIKESESYLGKEVTKEAIQEIEEEEEKTKEKKGGKEDGKKVSRTARRRTTKTA